MKVLVCGSRDFNDYKQLEEVLDGISISTILHGAARGADTLAGEYASRHGIDCISFPADWDQYGKSAGPLRNIKMLTEGNPDLVVASVGPNSIGTKHMVKIARWAGKEVKEIQI